MIHLSYFKNLKFGVGYALDGLESTIIFCWAVIFGGEVTRALECKNALHSKNQCTLFTCIFPRLALNSCEDVQF
jgi:hypothetical protein